METMMRIETLLLASALVALLLPTPTSAEEPELPKPHPDLPEEFQQMIPRGRIESIAVHPDDTATIYVGVGSGNLWKTVNNGLTWKPISAAWRFRTTVQEWTLKSRAGSLSRSLPLRMLARAQGSDSRSVARSSRDTMALWNISLPRKAAAAL